MKALKELKSYKEKNNVPVIVGGVFATFAPEICIKEDLVDMVCVGEEKMPYLIYAIELKKKTDYSMSLIYGAKTFR